MLVLIPSREPRSPVVWLVEVNVRTNGHNAMWVDLSMTLLCIIKHQNAGMKHIRPPARNSLSIHGANITAHPTRTDRAQSQQQQ